jgi:hypothetical protein
MGSQAENASGLTCCTPYDSGQELERSHFILDSNVAKEYLKGGDGAISHEEDRLSQRQPLRRSRETEEKLEWGDASTSASSWEVLRLRKMEGKSWRREVRVNKVERDKRIMNSKGKKQVSRERRIGRRKICGVFVCFGEGSLEAAEFTLGKEQTGDGTLHVTFTPTPTTEVNPKNKVMLFLGFYVYLWAHLFLSQLFPDECWLSRTFAVAFLHSPTSRNPAFRVPWK